MTSSLSGRTIKFFEIYYAFFLILPSFLCGRQVNIVRFFQSCVAVSVVLLRGSMWSGSWGFDPCKLWCYYLKPRIQQQSVVMCDQTSFAVCPIKFSFHFIQNSIFFVPKYWCTQQQKGDLWISNENMEAWHISVSYEIMEDKGWLKLLVWMKQQRKWYICNR